MASETPAEKKEREEKAAAEAAAAEKVAAEKTEAEAERRYEADYLIDNAVSLLDSRRTFVAAALAGSDRKTHTLAQAKDLLKKLDSVVTEPDAGAA